jgi:hypothetical protein
MYLPTIIDLHSEERKKRQMYPSTPYPGNQVIRQIADLPGFRGKFGKVIFFYFRKVRYLELFVFGSN